MSAATYMNGLDPVMANVIETTAGAGAALKPGAAHLLVTISKMRAARVELLAWRARVFAVRHGLQPRPRVRAGGAS